MKTRCDQRGFTVIELMTALLIAAILIALAVPGMQDISRRSKQRNAVGDISSMLARARSEAAARYKPVTVCVSAGGSTCDNSTAWGSGWLMFVDDNSTSSTSDDNDKQHQSGEEVIQVGASTPAPDTLVALNFSKGSGKAITFLSGGLLDSTTGGTLRYCSYAGSVGTMQAVTVNASGQVRYASDGKNSDGTTITACP